MAPQPPSPPRGCQEDQLVQIAVQLPLLPHVHGGNKSCRLAQHQERPVEGPHEGGASHLRDEVCVDIHAIGNNGPLVANANDIAEAFGGRVLILIFCTYDVG